MVRTGEAEASKPSLPGKMNVCTGLLSRSGDPMSEQISGSSSKASGTAVPREVFVYGDAEGFTQEAIVGPHRLTADEPKDVGGMIKALHLTIWCSRA